jgi:hypothetical protein
MLALLRLIAVRFAAPLLTGTFIALIRRAQLQSHAQLTGTNPGTLTASAAVLARKEAPFGLAIPDGAVCQKSLRP